MKHLKKLSVVLMLTTLFSVSFTSCIDGEVSPAVEAIYEAQADLIAAQASVQNAEAAYLLAQAEAEQAQAEHTLALAAQVDAYTAGVVATNAYTAAQRVQYLLQLVAATNLNVAQQQNALELAQVNFQIQLDAAIAAMEAAGVELAIEYAWKYANAMEHANDLMSDILQAKANLASAQLMQTQDGANNTVSWAYHLAQLQANVAGYTADIANLNTAITAMTTYIANPSTPEAILSGLRAQNDAYQAAIDAKKIEMQVQYNKIMAIYQQDDVRDVLDGRMFDAIEEHNEAVEDKNDRLASIDEAEEDVAALAARKATYVADLAAATSAVTAATAAYTAAWTALGKKNGAGVDVAHASYFEVSATGGAIVAGAAKYATPANLQQAYVNARIDVLDATADLALYQADFDALVVTYNNAAVALEAAQATFDSANYAGNLATAQASQAAAQAIFDAADEAYEDAKAEFELSPTGTDVTDGQGLHSNSLFAASPNDFDLGNIGIEDGVGTTYMRVTSWKETTIGSGRYVPASYGTTKYTPATLATEVAAIKADVTNSITANSQIYVWGDVTSDMPIADYDGLSYSTDAHDLNSTIPAASQGSSPSAAVFVEVESDDTVVTNLYTFNVATNKLGTNNFSSRPFFTSGAGTVASPYVFNTVLTVSSTDAGYDSTPNANGMADSAHDMLTAQAALWNAKLEVFKRQNAFDLGDDLLTIAENAFAYQKELFDNGVANLAILTADKAAAIVVQTAAKKAVDNAWSALGVEYAAGVAADSPKWWISKTGHTIDATAGYDVDFSGPGTAKALTLNAVEFNAEVAKAKLVLYNAAYLQGQIDDLNADIADWTLEIAQIQPIINAKHAVIQGLLLELTAAGVTYTYAVDADGYVDLEVTNSGFSSSLSPDLHAAIIAEWQAYWYMEQELEALENAEELNDNLIDAYEDADANDLSDLADDLAALKADLATAKLDLEVAKQALASGQASANVSTANIAYLQALITTLEARHANTLAIAAKYKALMQAALAS